MEMTRRGFLKFLASVPAVAIVAAVPTAVAEILIDVPKVAEADELADFYLDFDGTRLPVRSMVTHVADPVTFQLWCGHSVEAG